MVYDYKANDNFWDIESLDNLFTVAFYYPLGNYMILSYLDDDGIIDENDKEQIDALVRRRNKNFDGKVYLENLGRIGNAYSSPKVPGFQTFIERVGFGKNGYRKDGKTENNQVQNGSKNHRDVYKANGRLEVPERFYPVKDTDPEYDPNEHGFFFGYNTTQYDLTILAEFVTNSSYILEEPDDPYRRLDRKDESDDGTGEILSAKQLRAFNNELFEEEYKSNMPSRLAKINEPGPYGNYTDYQSDPWNARKAWLHTNRFIDVARLNEKMYRVGLKRLLGMLGHQILEFDGLADGKIEDDENGTKKEKRYELLAYNVSDVINLRWLFEHRVYQNNFELKLSLLEDYPETIYQRVDKKTNIADAFANGENHKTDHPYEPDIHYRKVDKYRLTIDSTSAKFVEKIIAPYNQMTDSPAVSFMYPSPKVAKQLSKERGYEIKPTDILEDTKDWFEENVAKPGTKPHDEFMEVYAFYDSIRGRNFNESDKYANDYKHILHKTNEDRKEVYRDIEYHIPSGVNLRPKTNKYTRELMQKYNTNLFYYDENQEKTSCLVNFSIGGIHGAEIHREKFNKDMDEYNRENGRLQFVKDQFDGDALVAINGDVRIQNIDGEEEKVRNYMKSGSTRKKASWKEIKKPKILKRKRKVLSVNKKYNYVSVGKSQHEDFTSYYPLLLTRLSVFDNPERGEGIDPYIGIFERRYEKKKEANDRSLAQKTRDIADLIQNAMKLLLNAATGAADATFDNNIRMNNNIIAMRIIGQLFAYRIGQAQTLAGARVPSTNTDGLYTMDLDEETNARILEEVSDDMYIGIEPEPLDRFVTKDSNNRMEIYEGEITSAKGGTLNSWDGPEPTQSLDHPSAVDRALAYYMRDHEDPANKPFDRELAQQSFAKIVSEFQDEPIEILRHFQWVLSSSSGTHQYVFMQEKDKKNPERIHKNKTLQQYNRVFLTKPDGNVLQTTHIATRRKVNPNTAKKRKKNGEVVAQHHPIGKEMLTRNGYVWGRDNDPRDEAKVMKVKNMPENQNVTLYNKSLYELTINDVQKLLNRLDIDAYIGLLEKTFKKSWSNVA